jgi:sulfite reductase alpha subunit-like flavoprotein
MSIRVTILVGTMTGTSQLVAQEVELAFADDVTRIDVLLMDALDTSVFEREGLFLVCSSTYGHGDVPDNAKAFLARLTDRTDDRDLSHVCYGVFALGDRTHVGTFCFGGRHFDAALSARGAQRCGEVLEHDASGGTLPEEVVLEWFPGWMEAARQKLRAAQTT